MGIGKIKQDEGGYERRMTRTNHTERTKEFSRETDLSVGAYGVPSCPPAHRRPAELSCKYLTSIRCPIDDTILWMLSGTTRERVREKQGRRGKVTPR
jgi:hypothetical protein